MLTIIPSSSTSVANAPKVGDVIVACYGYEASIESFAVVVKVGAKRVTIQEIGSNRVYTGGGGMNWTATPNLSDNRGAPVSRGWKDAGTTYRVKNNSYSNFYKWSGKELNCYNHH